MILARRKILWKAEQNLFGHAIHPILIVFPLGLLGTAVIFDIIYLIWGSGLMAQVSFWMMTAGIIGGLLAAPFGFIDWMADAKWHPCKNYRRRSRDHQRGSAVIICSELGNA